MQHGNHQSKGKNQWLLWEISPGAGACHLVLRIVLSPKGLPKGIQACRSLPTRGAGFHYLLGELGKNNLTCAERGIVVVEAEPSSEWAPRLCQDSAWRPGGMAWNSAVRKEVMSAGCGHEWPWNSFCSQWQPEGGGSVGPWPLGLWELGSCKEAQLLGSPACTLGAVALPISWRCFLGLTCYSN